MAVRKALSRSLGRETPVPLKWPPCRGFLGEGIIVPILYLDGNDLLQRCVQILGRTARQLPVVRLAIDG